MRQTSNLLFFHSILAQDILSNELPIQNANFVAVGLEVMVCTRGKLTGSTAIDELSPMPWLH